MEEVKVTPEVTEVVEPVVEEVVEVKPQTKTEILREMSEKYGVNMFTEEGLQEFKEYQDSRLTEQEKLQGELKILNDEKVKWLEEKNGYASQLEASKLGIPQDKIEDALKLAGGDVKELANVIKKYPIFQSKEGIKIGVQETNTFQAPTGNTEAEQYMADNPKIYKK